MKCVAYDLSRLVMGFYEQRQQKRKKDWKINNRFGRGTKTMYIQNTCHRQINDTDDEIEETMKKKTNSAEKSTCVSLFSANVS